MTDKKEKPIGRDYSKPITLIFSGKEGHRAFLEIATASPTSYNAEEAKKKAVENLRKQGFDV